MSHVAPRIIAAIIVGIAIILAALFMPSQPQFVSGGEKSAYVANPDNGDLYFCFMSECRPLNYTD